MRTVRCNYCGDDRFEERRIEYLYTHRGRHLLVPNTPVEVCSNCGMVYYDAVVLKTIEQRFLAIYEKRQEPDRYIQMPEVEYS